MCKLDLQLVSQTVESVWLRPPSIPSTPCATAPSPTRRTDVILLLDVDFWPATELSELMQSSTKYESLLQGRQRRTGHRAPSVRDRETLGTSASRWRGRPCWAARTRRR